MLGYLFIGFLAVIILLLYGLTNKQTAIVELFGKFPIRDTKHKKRKVYLDRFRESKQNNMSRNIIVQLLPWIGVLAVVGLLGNQYFYFGTVLSGSMEPVFKRGDLVMMQTVNKEPRVGDIIMYSISKFTSSVDEPITHRIISIDKNGGIRTKGDANSGPDSWVLKKENIMGKAVTIGEHPVTLKGFGSVLVTEAGEFSIANKLPEGMEISLLFERFRAIQPLLIFFATIFYLFVVQEKRTENNRRFNKNRKNNNPVRDN